MSSAKKYLWTIVLACLLMALLAAGARSELPTVITSGDNAPALLGVLPPPKEAPLQPELSHDLQESTAPPEHTVPLFARILSVLSWVLAIGGALALAAIIITALSKAAQNRQAPLSKAEDASTDRELSTQQAEQSLQQAHAALVDTTDARDSIVAAWLVLEESFSQHGVRREPWHTSSEYVESALSSLGADPLALNALGSLYRMAHFSSHEMSESNREKARSLLKKVQRSIKSQNTAESNQEYS